MFHAANDADPVYNSAAVGLLSFQLLLEVADVPSRLSDYFCLFLAVFVGDV